MDSHLERNHPPKRVAIVGGGILGMVLAWRLQGNGCQVTVIEAAPTIGGLAGWHSVGGYTWDRFYHVILRSDRHLLGLLEELSLLESLRWGTTRTGFYLDGRLHSLSSTLEFLAFPALGLTDKARLAATILYASKLKDWRRLERIAVTDWLRRLSGDRTFERIWLPLLKSKLGENYRITSASFIWATIARMYGARQSGLKRETFGYVDGGYARILDRFGSQLGGRGVDLLCGSPVERVHDCEHGVEVHLQRGEVLSFDHAVLTVACPRILSLCPQLTEREHARLDRVVYQGITCASVLLRQPLGGFYITNITDRELPFTAVIEMTALVDRSRFGGNSLVYLPRYLAQDDRLWSASSEEIRERFLGGLERMYPHFRRSDVLAFEVSKVRDMLALTTLNYSDQARPETRTSLPNVFIVNSAQIANGTLNVNETVGLANDALATLAPALRVPKRALSATQLS